MTSILPSTPQPAPLVACTISRDVQEFDLLIEDMEAVLGEAWGDLGFNEAEISPCLNKNAFHVYNQEI
jgi:pilus assembly protein CpaE